MLVRLYSHAILTRTDWSSVCKPRASTGLAAAVPVKARTTIITTAARFVAFPVFGLVLGPFPRSVPPCGLPEASLLHRLVVKAAVAAFSGSDVKARIGCCAARNDD